MGFIIRLLLNAAAMLLVAYLVTGIEVDGFYAALIAVLILGVVNALLKPILVLLTLPINILSLGLFTFIINAGLLWLVSTIVKGFYVETFWPAAVIGALILWVTSWVSSAITKK